MKRTRLRKKGKQKISLLQRKLWDECKRIIRARYPRICYTCGGATGEGAGCHTSHLWPKASLGAWLKYDLRLLRLCCYNCNINLGGNGAVFYAKMLKENGQKYMNNLSKERQISVKAYEHYEKLLAEYKKL